jgi:hypothetical protein
LVRPIEENSTRPAVGTRRGPEFTGWKFKDLASYFNEAEVPRLRTITIASSALTSSPGLNRRYKMSTHQVRRAFTAAAVAGAMLGAAQLPAVAARAAAPAVDIGVQTAFSKLGGLTFAQYHTRQGWGRVHGQVSGAVSGEVIRLYARQFPYSKPFAQVAGPAKLVASGNVKFSFSKVTPVLATRYKVGLFANKTARNPLAVSNVATIYVVISMPFRESPKCPRPDCTTVLHVHAFVPPSAMRTERAKKIYTYFAVNLSPTHIPPPPKFLYLGAGHPRVTRTRRVSAGEYTFTIKFTFRIGNDAAHWGHLYCIKDTVTTDGIGLPGHHHCGVKRVPARIRYLG